MFTDYTRLERYLFVDEHTLGDYLVEDIESEIALIEQGVSNCKRDISKSKLEIKQLNDFTDDPEKYRKHVLDTFSEQLKNYDQLIKKNTTLLKNLESELEKNKKNNSETPEILYLNSLLDFQIKSIKERIEDINSSIQTIKKDQAIYEKLPTEHLTQSVKNMLAFEKAHLQGYEDAVTNYRNQLRIMNTVRIDLINNHQKSFINKKQK